MMNKHSKLMQPSEGKQIHQPETLGCLYIKPTTGSATSNECKVKLSLAESKNSVYTNLNNIQLFTTCTGIKPVAEKSFPDHHRNLFHRFYNITTKFQNPRFAK